MGRHVEPLQEVDGDMDKAIEFLRKKGLASAKKRAGRIAAEGVVASYIHGEGRIGVLLELNCETDFVARTDNYKELAHEICLQIAASNPTSWQARCTLRKLPAL